MEKRRARSLSRSLALGLVALGALTPAPVWAHKPPVWVSQIGTTETDQYTHMSADALGNVYLVGSTWGCFEGDCRPDSFRDGWFAKFDPDGVLLWVRQVGNPGTSDDGDDQAEAIAAATTGDVFVAGATNSDLAGQPIGDLDAWVGKYTADGAPLWLRKYGTTEAEGVGSLVVDPQGNPVITGLTWSRFAGRYHGSTDVFVAKLSATDGAIVWARQFGNASADNVNGVATDGAGNVFLVGDTGAALTGRYHGQDDAWIKKLSPAGLPLWQRQVGTDLRDGATAVAADGNGDVFVVGYTLGCLSVHCPGGGDAWLDKYDGGDGHLLWRRQFGSPGYDEAAGAATDAAGNIIVSGRTSGDFAGHNRGWDDAWVAVFTGDGRLLWRRQMGTSTLDQATAAADAGAGCVYVAGETWGSFGAPFVGGYGDAWAAKVCGED
ncbi:MAG: SBBP repeat-containing protein [Rhodospirillales bacterium]